MEYKVIEVQQSATHLEQEVNRHLGERWVPLGGVAVIYSPASGVWYFYQALVRYPNAPDNPLSLPGSLPVPGSTQITR